MAGVLVDRTPLVAVGSLLGLGVEAALVAGPGRPAVGRTAPGGAWALLAGSGGRVLLDQLLVLAHVLEAGQPDRTEDALVLGVVVYQALRAARVVLEWVDERWRRLPADSRGLPGAPAPLPPRAPAVRPAGEAVVVGAAALFPLCLLVGADEVVGLWAAAAVAAVVLASGVPGLARLRRAPRGGAALSGVLDAVARYEPGLLLYYPNGPADLHCLQAWTGTLEDLDRSALVVCRDPAVLDQLPETRLPAVCLPASADLNRFRTPTARVALFVTNSPLNVDLVRDATRRTALIFHGDSDKVISISPIAKLYDEVWVAGEAARRRYLDAGVGVRPEAVRIVGRPQVRRVRPAAPRTAATPFTVLYAPTWEGLFGDPYESSLGHSGVALVRELLATEGVRVLYRPHPKSGTRDPACAQAHQEVVRMVEQAGTPHRADRPRQVDLYDTFNEADALLADVGGVVTDFLAADKPYLLVDGRGRSVQEYREAVPSARGAYVVGPRGVGLAEALTEARGTDPLAASRREVRTDLLGPPDLDPLATFAAAVDALGAVRPTAAVPR